MLRVFTAFSGYDSQCLALNAIGVQYELVGWSEIDKFAIQAHNVLFPQWSDRNFGDISKIDWSVVPDFDLFTYSSPCQDFSQAGKQRGGEKGSGTRSSLLWECERAIEAKHPKYLLFENVAAVTSKKFIGMFEQWQRTLEHMGYTNFVQVLNAKTHGYPTPVPQNRKRVFMVSVLNCEQPYAFPDEQLLTTRLRDVLEDNVEDKYYLSDEQIERFIACSVREAKRNNNFRFSPKSPEEISQTIQTSTGNRKTDMFVAVRLNQNQSGMVYSPDGVAPTICAVEGVKCNTKIVERERTLLGWTRDEKGNVVNYHPVQVANAVTSAKRDNTQNYVLEPGYRIRKLTPRECFRLMGVGEAEIDKLLSSGISNSQLYKLAGNSIVVNCLAAIFRQLFIGNFNTNLKNNKMMYKPFLTKDEAKGFGRSKKRALELLAQRKYNVHNICVGTARKVALCDGDELLHIIPRQAYQEYITPELPLAQ